MIWPELPALAPENVVPDVGADKPTFILPHCVWLKTLYASKRNWIRVFSPALVLEDRRIEVLYLWVRTSSCGGIHRKLPGGRRGKYSPEIIDFPCTSLLFLIKKRYGDNVLTLKRSTV